MIQNGARLVMEASEILDDMNFLLPAPVLGTLAAAPEMSEEERVVWDALEDGETQIDAVIGKTGLAAAVVAAQLMRMELKRLVRQLPGRVYVRVGG